MDETLKAEEVIEPIEKSKIPTVRMQIANPEDYQFAAQKEKVQELEDAEREFVRTVIRVSETYDIQAPTLLGKDIERRSTVPRQLLEEFEEAVRHMNPKGKQLPEESGKAEVIEPREALKHDWQYGAKENYQKSRQKYGHAGFLAMRLIEQTALSDLHQQWIALDRVRRDIGLSNSRGASANRSPYLWAEGNLKRRLVDLQNEELDVVLQQDIPPVEFGSPKTSEKARQIVLEKIQRDLPFSVVKEKYDTGVLESSVYREIHTFTKDPETGIRFITQQGFKRRGNRENFESWGTVGISGFGPDGEVYYLTPEYRGPAYSTKSGRKSGDSFKPFYRAKGTYSGIAPSLSEEKQIEIWEAYCRAECDTETTKDDFRKDSDWRYSLEGIYWGDQMKEMERYQMLTDRLKIAKLLQEASASDFGKVRFGIRLREEGTTESGKEMTGVASEEQLQQVRDLFDRYWQNPEESELAYQEDKSRGYIEFSYPYGQGGGSYPDDSGKVLDIRFRMDEYTKAGKKGAREIMIRDAYGKDTSTGETKYLRVEWDQEGSWKVERGRYSSTSDSFFLQPEESKTTLSQRDVETILTALNLFAQPKQRRR